MLLGCIEIESFVQKMVLESSLENIDAVEKLIAGIKREYALSDAACNDIWLSLNEAVSNAIRHGNKFDPAKKVHLSVESKYGRFICFTIKDEGEGFDPASVPDPTHPDYIGEPNGRGVYLIHKLADVVNYSHNGTSLEVCFDLFKN